MQSSLQPDAMADINSLQATLTQNLNVSLQALEGIDKVQEELRLAFSNPSYETYTSKKIKTLQFFAMLESVIKKEILLYSLFLMERNKTISDILEKIKSEEAHESAQKKPHLDQSISVVKEISNELNKESKHLLDLIEKKIKDVDIVIQKIKADIEYLTKLETVIEKRIIDKTKQLSLLIAEELAAIKPGEKFILPRPEFPDDEKYISKEKGQIEIDGEDVKSEFQNQLKQKIINGEFDNIVFNSELFAQEFVRKKLHDSYGKNEIPTQPIDSVIDHSMNKDETKNVILRMTELVDSFNIKIKTEKISSKLGSIENDIDQLKTARNAKAQSIENLILAENLKTSLDKMSSSISHANIKTIEELSSKVEALKYTTQEIEKLKPTIEDDLKNLQANTVSNNEISNDKKMSELMADIDVSEMLTNMDLGELNISDSATEAQINNIQNGKNQFDSTQIILQKIQGSNGNANKKGEEQKDVQSKSVNNEERPNKPESQNKKDTHSDQEDIKSDLDNEPGSGPKP